MQSQLSDPILVDIIGNKLMSIAEEIGIVLVRASYSTNIKERRDCSAALLDQDGRTIAQAEHIPLHLGSMIEVVSKIKQVFGKDIQEGDVFLTNDPYLGGGTHLPDITVVAPLFSEGELQAFATTVAHHAEVGGALGTSADVFSEGLRIPPVRVFRQGKLLPDILELIISNCRVPKERRGDLRAQFAAVRLAARRYIELCDRYSSQVVRLAREEWLDKAERQARTALTQLPEGEFTFADQMDDDGLGATDIQIAVTIRTRRDGVSLDFSGTDSQVNGAINVVWSALLATVYYAVKVVIDPELPANAGYYRVVNVSAPKGSIVNAQPPAPVLWRSDTCQRVADVILGAFAQAVPERVVAACNGTITGLQFSGWDDLRGQYFSYIETIGGGYGARPTSDGPDAVHAHMTNTSNLPVEALEMEYPLRVRRYGLWEGSGGAGQFRGGLGIVREVEIVAEKVHYRSKGDRTTHGPWGISGGLSGQCAKFTLNPETPTEQKLGSKESGLILHRGDVARVNTPGGGGYGNPRSRSLEALTTDLNEEKYSLDQLRENYPEELVTELETASTTAND